ncbi:MAG: hypothetical protein K0Q81_724 [Paenibacillus sp.]|nr:hypothetical protein [Paenibacillus sp.]
MNILFEGYFYSGSGYAEGNRALLRILDQSGYRVRILPKDAGDRTKSQVLTLEEQKYLSSFEKTELSSNDIFINRGSGGNLRHNPDFRINIAHTTFETDRLPAAWVPILNSFNQVWVQCKFNLNTFASSGVKVPIRFIPYFFNDAQYIPEGAKFPLPLSQSFKFLSVFDLIERKGYDLLLHAFLNEFSAKDDVALVIKIRNSKKKYKLTEIIKSHPKSIKERPPIYIIDKMLYTPELLSLYRACNAFVLPTRGEGWGRPLFEAMLMEKPVLATRWSGQMEYLNENNSLLLKVKRLVPVSIKDYHDKSKYEGHCWAEPSIKDLQRKMRYVVEHQNKARKIGRKARIELLEKYNMNKVAKHVRKEIERIWHAEGNN